MEEKKDEIKDAKIVKKEDKDYRLKRGIDFRLELALFLILGFLLGVVIKTEAVKRITIGFNDGSIPSSKQSYDFEKIEQDLAAQAAMQQTAPASDSQVQPSSDAQASPDNQVDSQANN